MSWKPVTRKDYCRLLKLILTDEDHCVSLSSRIKDQDRGSVVYVNSDQAGEISECFLFSSFGLLLPMLPIGNEGEEMKTILAGLRPVVHSVMGISSWVQKAESLLPIPPTTRIEYYLMRLGRRDIAPRPPRDPGVKIRRATIDDADALFPLQRSYEHEEVVVDPTLFSDTQCMRMLKKSLRSELVFLAEKDGRPLAKAGTNARGFDVDQIGGVFTAVPHRGKGLAGEVMEALLAAVFAEKSAACLFVKKANSSAVSLYNKLGFTTVADYVISYYGF
jgi:GNAT superfamily N-acetyltransferase